MDKRLREYTQELMRGYEIETALKVANEHITRTAKNPARLVSGIAVSSKSRVIARGLEFKLPLPVLADHDWRYPQVSFVVFRCTEIYSSSMPSFAIREG